MHIKEIELRNFKSFGRKVTLPLQNDFIAITGPNGSGKSNIVDALLFALSLSSSRAMRAERLPDLIYRGDNGKNPDFTQVTVKFDNTYRTIPIDKDVVEISRKVQLRNDKYHSIYYFNENKCTQSELHDILSSAGISSEGYNVVMQGDVTRIIEMSPIERRKIIDEIAGVAEFDEKKRKAIEELDVVKERIERVDVILEEVEDQLARLRDERDKALAYEAQREEKRRQEAFLLLAKLKEAKEELKDLEDESESLNVQVESLNRELKIKKVDLKRLEGELDELNSKIAHKGEDEQIAVKQEMVEKKGQIEQEATRAKMASKEIEEIETEQRKGYLEMDRIKTDLVDIADKIRDASIRKASILAETGDQNDTLDEYKKKISQADAKYARLRDELVSIKGNRERAKSEMADLMRESDRLLDVARRRSAEREEALHEIADSEETSFKLKKETREIEDSLKDLEKKATLLDEDRNELDRARIGIRREMAQVDERLQKFQMEKARAEASLRSAREGSGYSRAVEMIRSATNQNLLSGLHGTIAELGHVKKEYAAALEMAGGARLQNIVANTDGDAARAIEHLKKTRAGRATFLPLNKIRSGRPPAAPKDPGVVDYALNLVQFEDRFLPAFWHVFRDTLVVGNMDAARKLMGRYRMATLEGDIVEKGGAMTGGHYRSRLKFVADEGKKLAELSELVAQASAERDGLLDRLDRVEGEVSKVKRENEDLTKEQARDEFRLEEIQGMKDRIARTVQERNDRLKEMDQETFEVKTKLGSLETKMRSFEKDISLYEEKIEQLEGDMKGSEIPKLTTLADDVEEEIRSLERRVRDIESDITQHRLKEESLTKRKSELDERKEVLERKKKEAQDQKKASKERAKEAKVALDALAKREKEIEEELHGLKGIRSKLLDRIMAKGREVDLTEREIGRIRSRIDAAEAAACEIGAETETLRAEIESCGVEIDTEPPKSQTILRKIKALEQSMRDLEPVNMLAIGEYDRVNVRQETLQDRRETLDRERSDILEKLDRYDQMKREAFMISFEAINENFKDIFNQLSRGEGELILENPEDPLSGGMTIMARPDNKPFHRLEAMSGGEKSLTALSFIFAIQKHKPAPFYALDEIDMFLDGANVERVAKLIKGIAQRAQFIVVSLRKPMIQEAKHIVGVTMQENNISSVTGVSLN